jgi:hypothetical protein
VGEQTENVVQGDPRARPIPGVAHPFHDVWQRILRTFHLQQDEAEFIHGLLAEDPEAAVPELLLDPGDVIRSDHELALAVVETRSSKAITTVHDFGASVRTCHPVHGCSSLGIAGPAPIGGTGTASCCSEPPRIDANAELMTHVRSTVDYGFRTHVVDPLEACHLDARCGGQHDGSADDGGDTSRG